MEKNTHLTKAEKKAEGTLLGLDFINSLVYSPEGKKMTRNDKRQFIKKMIYKIQLQSTISGYDNLRQNNHSWNLWKFT